MSRSVQEAHPPDEPVCTARAALTAVAIRRSQRPPHPMALAKPSQALRGCAQCGPLAGLAWPSPTATPVDHDAVHAATLAAWD